MLDKIWIIEVKRSESKWEPLINRGFFNDIGTAKHAVRKLNENLRSEFLAQKKFDTEAFNKALEKYNELRNAALMDLDRGLPVSLPPKPSESNYVRFPSATFEAWVNAKMANGENVALYGVRAVGLSEDVDSVIEDSAITDDDDTDDIEPKSASVADVVDELISALDGIQGVAADVSAAVVDEFKRHRNNLFDNAGNVSVVSALSAITDIYAKNSSKNQKKHPTSINWLRR